MSLCQDMPVSYFILCVEIHRYNTAYKPIFYMFKM